MTDHRITLFCVVDGETTPFSVDIDSSKTVDHLKEAIKAKKTNDFSDVDADKLTLWCVAIPVVSVDKRRPIVLDEFDSAAELDPTDDLSDVFGKVPPKKTIHVIVQRFSSGNIHPEVALLRKQLSDLQQIQSNMLDSAISLGIIVKPEKKVVLTWSTSVNEATLDLKKQLFELYPQYAHDDYLEVFLYNGQPKPERISDD
ncbi:hypothetical protein EDD21DRAFT_392969 [Dissophora ornata]|nr:hypothetical protein EDD21DRAFT_392969 [Dissophora ornata]